MALLETSGRTQVKTEGEVIRRTQSICPECNRILDAEVFERNPRSIYERAARYTVK
jgi:uncharacterized radical SAM superfamily Fe-S cluster-containing enzyme